MSSAPEKKVKRRRVFYIPGYDPFHPRRYRELYRKEAATQAKISGYDIGLKPKTTQGPYGWHVTALIEGCEVETDIEVLYWSDIVKNSMGLSIIATYVLLARTAWAYIGTGALWRLMRLRKGPVIAALYPVVFLLMQLILALLLAWGIGAVISIWLPWWVGVLGLCVVPPVLMWFRKQDNRFFAYYLMHDYSYSAQSLGTDPPELRARIEEFITRIEEALAQDWDEVLVVGHSSGAHLGVSIMAEISRRRGECADAPTLSFLTLGQVVPMVSFLPRAHTLRADLQYLSEANVFWVDVTAPGDGCAFALCDPVAVSGVARKAKRWPLVFSAAFTQSLSPERWAELRWRFFRLHFQYLCAFDAPRDYDYFQITAGPRTLRARYAGRPASKSRIETPVNKYPQVAP